jgi:hypothetical protein
MHVKARKNSQESIPGKLRSNNDVSLRVEIMESCLLFGYPINHYPTLIKANHIASIFTLSKL